MPSNRSRCASSRDRIQVFWRALAVIIAIATTYLNLFAFVPDQARKAQAQSSGDLLIYSDHLASAWQDRSWDTTVDLTNAAPTFKGSTASIAITYNQPWARALFGTASPVVTTGYTAIAFQIYGTAPTTQIRVFARPGLADQDTPFVALILPGGDWVEVVVPLSQLGNPESISAIAIQDDTGTIQPTFFVDDIRLISTNSSSPDDPPGFELPEMFPTATPEDIAGTTPETASAEASDKTTTCCAELAFRVYLPISIGEFTDASAAPQTEIIVEPTPVGTMPEPVMPSDGSTASPVDELNGPTLDLTVTLSGHIHLTWTAVPDAVFYELRYSIGDRLETVRVTDTRWTSDDPSIGEADSATFSVVAITSQGTGRESNIVSFDLSSGITPGFEIRTAQSALTAADCQQMRQHLYGRTYEVQQGHNREVWVLAAPTECLNLLARELELMGSPNYWNCEQMLRTPNSAWIERFWRAALEGVGSSQICRQLKTLPSIRTGVSALRDAANGCLRTGAAKWTLQMDTITTAPGSGGQPPHIAKRYLFSVFDILCVQPKRIRTFSERRITYDDGTFDVVNPNTLRNAIQELTLTPQPLTWTKTEAIAHRGDRVSSPDNTNEAIKRAIEKGSKYIEIDTQLASDGKVIIAHGSVYKPDQGRIPDAPTTVYGPTVDCHNKNMEVDVTPFLTKNCDIGTQMALAAEGGSWLPKFRGERYLLLQNVLTDPRYRHFCGWFVEMKKSEHPQSSQRAQRTEQLGTAVQTILGQSGLIERCASYRLYVWVTSFEEGALDAVTDDRIHKLRVVSRFELVNWPARIRQWLRYGYDGVAIDLDTAGTIVERKSLPEYIRSHGLKVVAYTLIPGSQNQSTNQAAIDRKIDFFLTDILDDLLIRNGDQALFDPIYRVALSGGESRAIVIRNYEAYPITTTLFLDSYASGRSPLPIAPVVPGDSWVNLPLEASPTNPDMLVIEQAEITPYRRPAYETPNYAPINYYKTYLVGQQTVNTLVRGPGLLSVKMQHQNHSNVKPKLVSVGVDRAQFTVKGIAMPTQDGRNEVAVCPGESISISGRLIPTTGWELIGSSPTLFWGDQAFSAPVATIRPTYGKHEFRISADARDTGWREPRALNQRRQIMLRITVNVVPKTSGC